MKKALLAICVLGSGLLSGCYRIGGSSSGGGGGGGGTDVQPPTLGPDTVARYYDDDRDGRAGAGDRIVIPFDRPVRVNDPSSASFLLTTPGHRFGANAIVVAGPRANEATVVLGDGARLKTRQRALADEADPDRHRATGIELSDDLPPDAIENAITGDDAIAGAVLDIVPGFVESAPLPIDPALDVALADVNRDGALDLVVARVSGGAQLLIGDGKGALASEPPFGTRVATSVAIADADRDGIPDVLLGVLDGVELWLGDGAGHFLPELERLGLGEVRDVVLADLDGDGDLDALAGGAQGLRAFHSEADLLDQASAIDGTATVAALALADADRDGRLEILAATDEGVAVYRAIGGSAYERSATLGARDVRALAAGDLDRDGALDVVAGESGGTRVWKGDGAGGFADAALDLGADQANALALVDVDTDGALDLVLAAPGATRVLFQREGELLDARERLGPGASLALAAGDLDRDGDDELVLAPPSGGPRVCTGSLAGTWGAVVFANEGALDGDGISFALASADVDRDGDLDVLAGQNRRLVLLRGDGTGAFAAAEVVFELDDTRVNDVETGDLDRDGDLDVVLGLHGKGRLAWLGDGAGGFEAFPQEQEPGLFTKAIELGDVDGDGDLDLVQGNMAQAPDLVRLNLGVAEPKQGAGGGWQGFGPPVELVDEQGEPVLAHTGDVRLADFDRDGDLDVMCGYGPHVENRWFENDGAGAFTIRPQPLGLVDTRSIAVGDPDRDGDTDVVTGTAIGEHVLLNDGQGGFFELEEISVSNTYRVFLVDLDGDAAPELLIGNSQEQGLGAWRNDGSGRFGTSPWVRLEHRSVRTAIAADVDRDGDLDLLSSNLADETILLWLSR